MSTNLLHPFAQVDLNQLFEAIGDASELSSSRPSHVPSWLNDCIITCTRNGTHLAISRGENVVYIKVRGGLKVTHLPPPDSEDPEDRMVTSLAWVLAGVGRESAAQRAVYSASGLEFGQNAKFPAERPSLLVGYDSGYVRAFDESGTVKFAIRFHGDSVMHLRLRSSPPARGDATDTTEELTIVYPGVVVRLDSESLQTILSEGLSDEKKGPSYRKWRLDGQVNTEDAAFCGRVEASVVQPSPPRNVYRLLSVGRSPALALYQPEGTAAFSAAALAKKMASAVLSIGRSWLWSGGSAAQTKVKGESGLDAADQQSVVASSICYTRALNDTSRRVTSLTLDPSGRLAALADEFGRVMLVQTLDLTVLRMWKGYRDAQCGWVHVAPDAAATPLTGGVANAAMVRLYLVIYAPRRRLLEVWPACSGPRHRAVVLPSAGRLLYTTSSYVGPHLPSSAVARCYFLLEDGKLFDVIVRRQAGDPSAGAKALSRRRVPEHVLRDQDSYEKFAALMKAVSPEQIGPKKADAAASRSHPEAASESPEASALAEAWSKAKEILSGLRTPVYILASANSLVDMHPAHFSLQVEATNVGLTALAAAAADRDRTMRAQGRSVHEDEGVATDGIRFAVTQLAARRSLLHVFRAIQNGSMSSALPKAGDPQGLLGDDDIGFFLLGGGESGLQDGACPVMPNVLADGEEAKVFSAYLRETDADETAMEGASSDGNEGGFKVASDATWVSELGQIGRKHRLRSPARRRSAGSSLVMSCGDFLNAFSTKDAPDVHLSGHSTEEALQALGTVVFTPLVVGTSAPKGTRPSHRSENAPATGTEDDLVADDAATTSDHDDASDKSGLRLVSGVLSMLNLPADEVQKLFILWFSALPLRQLLAIPINDEGWSSLHAFVEMLIVGEEADDDADIALSGLHTWCREQYGCLLPHAMLLGAIVTRVLKRQVFDDMQVPNDGQDPQSGDMDAGFSPKEDHLEKWEGTCRWMAVAWYLTVQLCVGKAELKNNKDLDAADRRHMAELLTVDAVSADNLASRHPPLEFVARLQLFLQTTTAVGITAGQETTESSGNVCEETTSGSLERTPSGSLWESLFPLQPTEETLECALKRLQGHFQDESLADVLCFHNALVYCDTLFHSPSLDTRVLSPKLRARGTLGVSGAVESVTSLANANANGKFENILKHASCVKSQQLRAALYYGIWWEFVAPCVWSMLDAVEALSQHTEGRHSECVDSASLRVISEASVSGAVADFLGCAVQLLQGLERVVDMFPSGVGSAHNFGVTKAPRPIPAHDCRVNNLETSYDQHPPTKLSVEHHRALTLACAEVFRDRLWDVSPLAIFPTTRRAFSELTSSDGTATPALPSSATACSATQPSARAPTQSTASAPRISSPPIPSHSPSPQDSARMQERFLQASLANGRDVAYELAKPLGRSEEWMRHRHLSLLLDLGRDDDTEEILRCIENKEAAGNEILAVGRKRLGRILNSLRSEGTRGQEVVALISPDVFSWICKAVKGESQAEAAPPPLSSVEATYALLVRACTLLPSHSIANARATQLVETAIVIKKLLKEGAQS